MEPTPRLWDCWGSRWLERVEAPVGMVYSYFSLACRGFGGNKGLVLDYSGFINSVLTLILEVSPSPPCLRVRKAFF